MIQCHVFNSFARVEARHGGVYILSQFIGGMAAPLFLFMAGMTFGFQMESLERRQLGAGRRWIISLQRAGYILGLAYLFRLSNCIASLPNPTLDEFLKVDILNAMGLAMAAFALLAVFEGTDRIRFAIAGGLAVAAAAPLVSALDWSGVPTLVRDYLAPSPAKGRFAFFPCAAYVGFGIAAGAVVKRVEAKRMDRLLQWTVIVALGLIVGAQYFANLPYSIYAHSDFWSDSPALIVIRTGVALLLLASGYLWTGFGAGGGWAWVQRLGKTSLLVYWVHIMLVYGNIAKAFKRALTVPQAFLATVAVIMLMVALAEARLRWKERQSGHRTTAAAAAGASAASLLVRVAE